MYENGYDSAVGETKLFFIEFFDVMFLDTLGNSFDSYVVECLQKFICHFLELLFIFMSNHFERSGGVCDGAVSGFWFVPAVV